MNEYISIPIKTKALRAKCHYIFDKIWQCGLMTRDEAYFWLAKKMFISNRNCHFRLFKRTSMLIALNICINYLNDNYKKHDYPLFKTIGDF